MDLRLPDFLGIGALKAATTYLDALLRHHPQLCLPRAVKEIQFFNRYFDRGPQWYAGLFESCGERRRGEVSPQYLADPACPPRIAGLLPEVQLIVSVRDPVQRAYSQYKHWVEERGYRESFEVFLDEHPGALRRGEYHRSVSRYLDHFPRDRMHFLLAEDLVSDPEPVLEGVFGFLGVDRRRMPPTVEPPRNVSAVPKHHRAYVGAKRITRWLYRVRGAWVVDAAKRLGAERLFEADGRGEAFLPLTPETEVRLRDHYATDVADLSRLLGRDLAGYWWDADHDGGPAEGSGRRRLGS